MIGRSARLTTSVPETFRKFDFCQFGRTYPPTEAGVLIRRGECPNSDSTRGPRFDKSQIGEIRYSFQRGRPADRQGPVTHARVPKQRQKTPGS